MIFSFSSVAFSESLSILSDFSRLKHSKMQIFISIRPSDCSFLATSTLLKINYYSGTQGFQRILIYKEFNSWSFIVILLNKLRTTEVAIDIIKFTGFLKPEVRHFYQITKSQLRSHCFTHVITTLTNAEFEKNWLPLFADFLVNNAGFIEDPDKEKIFLFASHELK